MGGIGRLSSAPAILEGDPFKVALCNSDLVLNRLRRTNLELKPFYGSR